MGPARGERRGEPEEDDDYPEIDGWDPADEDGEDEEDD
jgi:hypothetical protein